MQKKRIFISHASKGDKACEAARDRYQTALDAAGFHVLLDVDLGEGPWRPQLIQMMWECHAAVILLGKKAVCNSAWVACEAFLLHARKVADSSFQIYPVRLDTTTTDDICNSTWLEPSDLRGLTIFDDTSALPKITCGVAALHPPDIFAIQLQPYVERLLEHLNLTLHGSLTVTAFERAYMALGHRRIHADRAALRDVLVYYLTRTPLPTAVKALTEFQVDEEIKRKLVECIAPLWIPFDLVSSLKPCLSDVTTARTFTLNTGQSYEAATHYTAPWYLARAIGYPPELRSDGHKLRREPQRMKMVTLPQESFADPAALNTAIRERLCTELELDEHYPIPDQLRHHHKKARIPTVVILPELSGLATESTAFVDGLEERFPGVTFLRLASKWPPKVADSDSSLPMVNMIDEADAISAFRTVTKEKHPRVRSSYVLQQAF